MYFFEIFKKINTCVLILMMLLLTSCAKIAGFVSKPTYSVHGGDKIFFDEKNVDYVFIEDNVDDNYKIHSRVIKDVRSKLIKNGIHVVNDINKANYILSIHIRGVFVDVDYNFANKVKNTMLAKETNYSYIFDSNNMPHSDNGNINAFGGGEGLIFKKITPSILYTLIGSGVGFGTSFLLAGSTAPFTFGFFGGIIGGSAMYFIYNTFRNVGIIVSYDTIVEVRTKQVLNHKRKVLTKKSSNSSDEIYYSYNDNLNTLTSKNIAIAIGSRALTKEMIDNICPVIANNTAKIFRIN